MGLIPREHSSGGRQRLGAISKQGNSFLRMLLVEAAQSVVQLDENFENNTIISRDSEPKGIAKVAAARRSLAVRLYWMPAHLTHRIQRSFASKQPAGAPGRPPRRIDR